MSATLPPSIKFQPLVANQTLPGGKVYFFAAGTTTPQAVYAADGTTPLTNPVILDANGAAGFRLGSGLAYKIDLFDANNVHQVGWPEDNVQDVANIALGVANAAAKGSDLADTTLATKGAGLLGFNAALAYAAGTVGATLVSQASSITSQASSIASQASSIASQGNNVVGKRLAPLVVDLHFGVLCGRGWLGDATELGGYTPTPATATTNKSPLDTQISVSDPTIFRVGQLICYQAPSTQWYSAIIHGIAGSVLTLDRQMPEGISLGASVIYFYANNAHPNQYGYKAIADGAIRQMTRRQLLVHTGKNYVNWTAVAGATVSSLTLGTPSTASYSVPGTSADATRATKVDTTAAGQGAISEYVALPGGWCRTHLVLDVGERTGGFSGAVTVTVEELRSDGVTYSIATQQVDGYHGLRAIDIDYAVSQNSSVRVKVLDITGTAASFTIGQIQHYQLEEAVTSMDHGTHVLFGDSWFASGYLMNRLVERFPKATFINQGVAGQRADNLIARFDTDIRPISQQYTWLMCGTNDYYAAVAASLFEQRMNQIAAQVASINSQLIVFNPSVGDVTYAVDPFERLSASRDYANNVSYASSSAPVLAAGARQRTASLSVGPVSVAAGATVVLAAVPGRTIMPALVRWLYSSGAGLVIKVGFAGAIDTTTLVDPVTFTPLTEYKGAPLPRPTDNQTRFILITANNPTGAAVVTTLAADISWVAI